MCLLISITLLHRILCLEMKILWSSEKGYMSYRFQLWITWTQLVTNSNVLFVNICCCLWIFSTIDMTLYKCTNRSDLWLCGVVTPCYGVDNKVSQLHIRKVWAFRLEYIQYSVLVVLHYVSPLFRIWTCGIMMTIQTLHRVFRK